VLLFLLTPIAFAAGLDADGSGLPASDSEGSTGLVPAAPRGPAGTGAGSVRAGAIVGGLVRTGPDTAATALVGDAAFARAQVAARFLPWFGASASLPFRLGATSDVGAGAPSLGDLRATAWGVLGEGPRQLSAGLGASLPSGSPLRYTGSGRVVPHGRVAGRVAADTGPGTLELLGSTWAAHEGNVDEIAAVGGLQLGGAARIGGRVQTVGAGVSLRAEAPLEPAIRERRGLPVELALDGGWEASEHVALTGLLSRAVVGGVGAPELRASVGVTYRWAPPPPPEPEPVATQRTLSIVDPDGRPVSGATVRLSNGMDVIAGVDGRVEVPVGGSGTVSARGLGDASLPEAEQRLVLPWATVPLHVQVAASDGSAIAPELTLTGPTSIPIPDPLELRADLVPGVWILEVSAPGFGRQRRSIEVLPRSVEAVDLEVVLLPQTGDASLALTLSDPQGRGISGAELRVDGVSIGTAARGTIGVEGLPESAVEVEVRRKRFKVQDATVDLTSGSAEAEIALYYAPGTVRVTARGPSGPVSDGLVLVDGPRALPPLPLGDGGESLIELGGGAWTLALTSPAHGLQERELDIGPNSPVPVEAAFVLLGADPREGGPASLWVDVRDVEGTPIRGANVSLDGQPVGTTATGGSLRLEDLPVGAAQIEVTGRGFDAVRRTLQLDDGLEVVTLPIRWNPGTMEVAARDRTGPADALVAFAGPATYAGGPLGPPGRRTFLDLPSGEWEVLATHPSGMEVAWATSRPDPGMRTRVDFHLGDGAGEGSLTLTVTDPEGQPVDGAELWVDGQPLITASGGSVRVSGLQTGATDLEVRHPHHQAVSRSADVSAAGVAVDVQLPWAAGVIDLVVESGAPLDAALVYASGPRSVEPRPVVEARRPVRMALGPGSWDLLVSAPTGLAEAHVDLPEETRPPEVVRLRIGAVPGALVHVVDRRQHPIAGVPIHRDGTAVAVTDEAGTAIVPVAEGRPESTTLVGAVAPVHPGFEVTRPTPLSIQDEHWFEVTALPRPVPIEVRHDGAPVSATVTANGPGRIDPVTVDGDGLLALPPGAWELSVDPGEALAAQRLVVEVPLEGDLPMARFELVPARVRATATGLELIDVRFGLDEDVAGEAYADVLEEVAASITSDPTIQRVEVHGHADPTGGIAYNDELSRRRATSIVAALIARGVPAEQLDARGFGASRPLADNGTAEGRATNRRVEFRVIPQ